jgi:hypothetical protein
MNITLIGHVLAHARQSIIAVQSEKENLEFSRIDLKQIVISKPNKTSC